ncbi:hypothetical protein Tdes44962_MAKER04904 [Teratosphaeria destructans]|uniref:Uncharacterized protein n=1 Tax=Teratosphaeria destructans TaxID=418781 RepID=A0A9W7SL73_9PEZI|nr:hypothetical protein Tdes44962_MAKER04904 [Teratosphaeria destructans]
MSLVSQLSGGSDHGSESEEMEILSELDRRVENRYLGCLQRGYWAACQKEMQGSLSSHGIGFENFRTRSFESIAAVPFSVEVV